MDRIIASIDRYLSAQGMPKLSIIAGTRLCKSTNELSPQDLSLLLIEIKNSKPKINIEQYIHLVAELQANARNDQLCAEIAKLSTMIEERVAPLLVEVSTQNVPTADEQTSDVPTAEASTDVADTESHQSSPVYVEWVAQNLDKVRIMYPGEWADGDEPRYVCEYLAYEGLLHILKEAPRSKNPEMFAVQTGQLDVIKWVVESGQPIHKHGVFQIAAYWGHLHILDYMYKTFTDDDFTKNRNYYAVSAAASNGKLSVIQWLGGIGEMSFTQAREVCALAAAEKGHINIIKYLSKDHPFYNKDEVAKKAASGGHLALVQFLFARMLIHAKPVIAAAENQPHVLEWLKDTFE